MPSKRLFAAALVAALVSAAVSAQPQPAQALRIGIVDLTVIFRDYVASADYMGEMNRALRENRARMERLNREIASTRRAMQDYAAGTPERQAQEEKLKEKATAARMLEMETQTKESTLRTRMLLRIYNEAMQTVEEYARENDLDMVLKQQSLREYDEEALAETSPTHLVLDLSRRSILFNKPEFDITAQVLEAMNAAYERRKAAEGAGDAAP